MAGVQIQWSTSINILYLRDCFIRNHVANLQITIKSIDDIHILSFHYIYILFRIIFRIKENLYIKVNGISQFVNVIYFLFDDLSSIDNDVYRYGIIRHSFDHALNFVSSKQCHIFFDVNIL